MESKHEKTSRRAFFLQGGAALGAGVAAAAPAVARDAAMAGDPSQAADRETIRQLHVAFTGLMEAQAYEAAAALFAADSRLQLGSAVATGAPAIRELLVGQYGGQSVSGLHAAYRPNGRQRQDTLAIGAHAQHATATWHVDVRVSSPLPGDSTAAQMARLQGQLAEVRWESGVLQAAYVRQDGRWLMASLDYRPA